MATETAPTLADVEAARARLAGKGVRTTPLYSTETFGRMIGCPVHLKAETLQRTGSFKIRGATNKLETLTDEERKAGVVAASAGNHGQAVAWAAREAGVEATIFMPAETPMAKVEPTRNYGARAELTGATFGDRARAPGAEAGGEDRRSAGGRVRSAGREHRARLHDRRGHRGQASGRADVAPAG